nr:Acyl-CoA oxidase dehydrogenase domain containing protein [Haemonchus contortus]
MVRHEGQPGAKGIFCLLIEDGMEGFSQAKKESKLGWNTQPTRIITFEDVKVPVSNQIGPDNYGFNIAMAGINGGRVNIASCSLGAAQQSLDLAIDHLKVRKQFGKRLSDFQWNQFKLAEMATKLYCSRFSNVIKNIVTVRIRASIATLKERKSSSIGIGLDLADRA